MLLQSVSAHPVYISRTQIHYNETTESLEISIKIFADDLENALINGGSEALHIGSEKEIPETDRYILTYLTQRFQLLLSGEQLVYEWVGKELSEDMGAVWCYLEIEGIDEINEIEVYSRLLTEMFDNQTNIIELEVADNTQYLHLTKDNFEETISFQ